MARAFLVVLDSVGCGGAPDAAAFGDEGSNTLAHIAQACMTGTAEEGRSGPLLLPNLDAIGLGAAIRLASGAETPNLVATPTGAWGAATEISPGKDTPSGHWELAGLPVPWDWHYFPDTHPSFSADLVAEICRAAGTDGILGDRHSSGTVIIEEEGAAHLQTGYPICYTSADSVLQIAAHEEHFGLDRLLKLCADLAPTLHGMKVGRVIARPFVGCVENGFTRTTNRKDFAILPPKDTLCDRAKKAGCSVHAIGKIGDIFSMRGIDDVKKGSDAALMEHLLDTMHTAEAGSFTFANFVEFDSLYGHRRDVSGYARALEWFDGQLPRLTEQLQVGDILIFTADHGNDPTWSGTDHTRERVPVLALGMGSRKIGQIGFSDIAATIAEHLDIPAEGPGRSFL
ncbi:MAG: phosphopentomutase [Pseudoruegeria sp.]